MSRTLSVFDKTNMSSNSSSCYSGVNQADSAESALMYAMRHGSVQQRRREEKKNRDSLVVEHTFDFVPQALP